MANQITIKKHTRLRKSQTNTNKYVLVFGDSFIGPLKLFKQPNWKLIKFKGGTMKGLCKLTNPNRQKIISEIDKYAKTDKLAGVIFCFGTVDIQFSYYYTKLTGKSFNQSEMIGGYIDFIKSVVDTKKYKVGVQLAYPTSITDDNYMYDHLNNYAILDEYIGLSKLDSMVSDDTHAKFIKTREQLLVEHKPKIMKILGPEFVLSNRIARVQTFNKLLRSEINSLSGAICVDMNKYLVGNSGQVKPHFLDISSHNIHFRWEPQIPYILKEFRQFGITSRYIDKARMAKSEKKYLRDKKLRLRNRQLSKKTPKKTPKKTLKKNLLKNCFKTNP